ncbi:hypothetical protein [Verrucosispora sioxanthis]|uniref:LPXTG cell wall anchor domain-containing protein n=1 Tax=Verrucosispora sioxanthis TaxID=2499994 RepID=A0A6M1L9K3_9ACTN|nr:hypothetical protein [Verrucosispora sioxanthis]NEE65747.1 hypothetical protein [Verrucosispora sioxanthis]NGM14857.1 hypothetical protein [Verrucosispora sioxanthis]
MAVGRRWLSRTAAAALLLIGGIAVPAGPASAVDPEPKFTFELTGTTIPVGFTSKTLHLKVTNLTDETPSVIQYDVRPDELAWRDRAWFLWGEGGGSGECDGDSAGWYCRAGAGTSTAAELLPAPGGTVDYPISISTGSIKEPFEGKVQIEVYMIWGEDGERVTETREFTVTLVDDAEADLAVVAPDVRQSVRVGAGGRLESTGTLNPGETGAVRYRIVNHGRKAVSGVTVDLRLPEGVTFTRPPQECAVDDDGRSAVCTYDSLALVPVGEDTEPNDDVHSAVELYNLVTVPADITAPVTLADGTVQVEGLTEGISARSAPKPAVLPANAVAVPAADVDASDNQDGYAVVVAAKKDDDNGGGGGLPVTGPQAGLIAGAGLAMVAAGIVLLLARRRRSVAFISGDDTTAS